MNTESLPPGPPLPAAVQTPLHWLARPWWLAQLRRRYGSAFTLRDRMTGTIVVVSDPADIKTVFTGSPDDLHAGEGNAILGPLVGPHSVLLLDGRRHLSERKLQLPAFHGERIARTVDLMREATVQEVARWPLGTPFSLHERTQLLTLDIIVRVVLGVQDERHAEALRHALRASVEVGGLQMLMWLHPALANVGPWKRYKAAVRHADTLLFAEIGRRRRATDLAERSDVLSMLIQSHDEAGDEVDDAWIRDELMTLLVAGHETTATGLAWAFERLLRHPDALARATAELDDPRSPYLDAVVKETLRVRPVIWNVARVVKRPFEVAGHRLPVGTTILPSIGLVQLDDENFDDAAAFRPERWLDGTADAYTWIPFGGGTRRCLGATFAQTEMAVVLRTVLQHAQLRAARPAPEGVRVRNITQVPAEGTRVVMTRRLAPAQATAAAPGRRVAVPS